MAEVQQAGGARTKAAGKKKAPTLYCITAFKLAKGLLLLLLAARVYTLHDKNLPEQFRQTLDFFHLDPEKQFFTELGNQLAQITPAKVILLARGTGLYSLFSLIEGTGLLLRVPWAGWLTIGESAFFIPIEIYELMQRFSHGHHLRQTVSLLMILGLNVLIVWYLYQNRGRLFRHHTGGG